MMLVQPSSCIVESLCCFLQARQLALVACTCKDFSRLASSEELWEKLFRSEFADARAQPQEASRVGWKCLFAAAWRERSERRRHRQSLRGPLSRLPWPGGELKALHLAFIGL